MNMSSQRGVASAKAETKSSFREPFLTGFVDMDTACLARPLPDLAGVFLIRSP